MHTFLHILAIAGAVIAGLIALIVVCLLVFFGNAEANGENPFQ